MSAHHADDLAGIVALQEAVHRLADGMVVQGPGEGDLEVVAPPAMEAVVRVGLSVVAAVVRLAV